MAPKLRKRRRSSGLLPRLITWGGLSLLAHLLIFGVGAPLFNALEPSDTEPLPPMNIVMLDVAEPEEPEEDEPEIDWDGQLVDTPKPNEEIKPEDADYLAEYNNTVEEETVSERFRINPEVLSNVFSEEDKVEYEDLVDVNAEEPSTGAQIGNERFAPDRHGALATLPSPFKVTNKDGFEKPTVASHSKTTLAGAPNNDLLKEKRGNDQSEHQRVLVCLLLEPHSAAGELLLEPESGQPARGAAVLQAELRDSRLCDHHRGWTPGEHRGGQGCRHGPPGSGGRTGLVERRTLPTAARRHGGGGRTRLPSWRELYRHPWKRREPLHGRGPQTERSISRNHEEPPLREHQAIPPGWTASSSATQAAWRCASPGLARQAPLAPGPPMHRLGR